ncbi:DnaJ C-terminal domain-containing protein [candidate division KSB1 bacterium]
MDFKDYYKTLGVDKNAAQNDIKLAYRKLAKKYHPDVNKGDKESEAKFKELSEAYEVLKDSDKRKKYDQLGANWKYYQHTDSQKTSDYDWSKYTEGADDGERSYYYYSSNIDDLLGEEGFSDFFNSYFRNTQKQQGDRDFFRGNDLQAEIEITLKEAFHGTTKIFEIQGKRIKINIKPGIHDGQILRLKGRGTPNKKEGQSGDLYIKVKISKHPVFERKGNDLYMEESLNVYTAVLGGKIKVSTLSDSVMLTIPKETEHGKIFRLKGKGMPKYQTKNEYGDLYVKIILQMPKNLNKKEINLFQELQTINSNKSTNI